MLSVIACLLLGAVLVVSAGLKLLEGADARAALATYGLRDHRVARAAWLGLIVVEIGLAVGVGAGLDGAAYGAAGMLAAFAIAQAAALAAGRGGAPCACFGARGRVGRRSLARASLLACAFAALPLLPRRTPSTDEWLAIGLGAALLGLVVLAVVVLALARELGTLRLALGPQGALEVPHEGPEVGGRSALIDWFDPPISPGRLGLAVFTARGCRMCQTLEPAIAALARDPRVSLRRFDEVRDAGAWSAADVPGSPFAVALDVDGTVLAKGTFNTGAQLESVLAAAERRRGGLHV
jgi:hypothetical protein